MIYIMRNVLGLSRGIRKVESRKSIV